MVFFVVALRCIHATITPRVCLRFQEKLLDVVVHLSCWLGGL